jgi:hypothetical protein
MYHFKPIAKEMGMSQKRVSLVLIFVSIVLILFSGMQLCFGWDVLPEKSCYPCPSCQPCPDCDCPNLRCPDVTCPDPVCNCPECPDVVCPDPCPAPCPGDTDVAGSYTMIGMGASNGLPIPEVVLGTITIFPDEKYGYGYQCLISSGSHGRMGCAAYFLKRN